MKARITVPMVTRMRDLRRIGLSTEAICRLIDLDYGQRPGKRTVWRYTQAAEPGIAIAGIASDRFSTSHARGARSFSE